VLRRTVICASFIAQTLVGVLEKSNEGRERWLILVGGRLLAGAPGASRGASAERVSRTFSFPLNDDALLTPM
jgi:hypothetical protein